MGHDLDFAQRAETLLKDAGLIPITRTSGLDPADMISVRHTRGPVVYAMYGSLEKNQSLLPHEVKELSSKSALWFLRALLCRCGSPHLIAVSSAVN